MPEIIYRLATEFDTAVLADLRIAFLKELGQGGDELVLRQTLQRYFRRALSARTLIAWVAEADGKVVATGGLVFHERPPSWKSPTGRQGYILNLYTMPPWRKQGIARDLMQHLIEQARAVGCQPIALHAAPKAVPLYERLGFQPHPGEMRLAD